MAAEVQLILTEKMFRFEAIVSLIGMKRGWRLFDTSLRPGALPGLWAVWQTLQLTPSLSSSKAGLALAGARR
jgi:hypothetical protein